MAWGGFQSTLKGALRAAVALAAICATAAVGHAAPAGQRFKIVEIIDQNGFERPMPAVRAMIPHEWQAQGGIVWNPGARCAVEGQRIQWSAGNPRSGTGVEIIPVIAWQANNLPIQIPTASGNCLDATITSARAYLEALVGRFRPGARILDYRDRPDLAHEFGVPARQENLLAGELRTWVEAGDILIGYNYQGTNYREAIRGIAIFHLSRMPGVMPGEVREFLMGNSTPAFAMRAPDGALDFRLFDAIHRSLKPNPEWSARMAKHNAAIARTNLKGAADRAAISSQTSREVAEIMNKGWYARQESADRMHEKTVRAIRGVELYADPVEGRPVELPNIYNHAWRLQDGTYMMTDDPNFDPNAQFGVNGIRLQVTQ